MKVGNPLMADFLLDSLTDVFNMIKRKEYNEAQEKLSKELERFRDNEVEKKRQKVSEINRSIFEIDSALMKLRLQYVMIQKESPRTFIAAIESFILELKKEKRLLEKEKRLIARA